MEQRLTDDGESPAESRNPHQRNGWSDHIDRTEAARAITQDASY